MIGSTARADARSDAGRLEPRSNRTSPSYYCVVPRDQGAELYRVLCAHFSGNPTVIVVRDRRLRERSDGYRGQAIGDERRNSVPDALALPPEHAGRVIVAPRRRGRLPESTERLVARAQDGDRAAFGEIYRRELPKVRGYARRFVGDVERADDLAQAAFLRAFAALPRYEAREGVPFECWLFTIVRNCAHTALEKERRQLLVEPADLAERADREQSLDPPAACSGSWIGDERLQRHYMRLPLAQRQVLALRFGFDFDGARTASVLGRTVTDVNTIQHRALRQLAAWLKPQPRPFEGAATT